MCAGNSVALSSLEPAGLYIHIPFCIQKCFYCGFYSVTDLALRRAFVASLVQEMHGADSGDLVFNTLYIGGGTPSVLSASDISQIIEQVRQSFQLLSPVEITMEVNPGTVNKSAIGDYCTAGVNRINIGVQSFYDPFLKALGRLHKAGDACLAFKQVREQGIDNIGLDLIYGLPGQTSTQWLRDLQTAISLEPEHISCYILSFELGTPLYQKKRQGVLKPLPAKRICELYETAVHYLGAHGYQQYEISNFARVNKSHHYRSLHNSKYWSFTPYLGLGPSAHSFVHPWRWWNHRSVEQYMNRIRRGGRPVAGKERLSYDQQMIETIYIRLRTNEGIDLTEFEKKFGIRLADEHASLIRDLEKQGKLIRTPTRLALTSAGMLHHNAITLMFL